MKTLLKIIGSLYGLFGLMSLFTVVTLLISANESQDLQVGFFTFFGSVVLLAVIAILSFLIMYSFWALKWWGRYLAIGFILAWFALHVVYSVISQDRLAEFKDPFVLIKALLYGTTLVICLRGNVKELMRN